MFLLRSAFWLTLAFLMMAPQFDFGTAAGDLSAKAVTAGQRMIVSTIEDVPCSSLECAGGRAVLAAAAKSFPSIDTAMQDSSNVPVPVPRPRPDWMG
jgi:hypothetical protein